LRDARCRFPIIRLGERPELDRWRRLADLRNRNLDEEDPNPLIPACRCALIQIVSHRHEL